MKQLKYFSVLILTGFLIDCGTPGGGTVPPPKRPDKYYDDKNKEDENRGSVLDRSRKRYSGPKCEGNSKCEEYCKDIYNRRSVREDCLELARDQVEKLWDIYEIFESPKEDELRSIDPDDFETFVEIDLRPLDTLIGKFNSSEAKRVLTWIGEESDIAEVFQDEDDDFELFKELLEGVNTNKKSALSKNIEGGDSFMEIALSNEGPALDWIHSFFSEECDSDSDEEVCILKEWYCEVDLNDDSWDELLGYEDFEQIIDDILEEYKATTTNQQPSWWDLDEELEARDLEVDQLEDLCDLALSERS